MVLETVIREYRDLLGPKDRKELQDLKAYQESLERMAHQVAMGLKARRDLLARVALLDPPDLA